MFKCTFQGFKANLTFTLDPERIYFVWRFHARKRKVKPLRASQGLSETFPCTGYIHFLLKEQLWEGIALRTLEFESALSARPSQGHVEFERITPTLPTDIAPY